MHVNTDDVFRLLVENRLERNPEYAELGEHAKHMARRAEAAYLLAAGQRDGGEQMLAVKLYPDNDSTK